jgi:hypothetical protein
MYGIALIKLGAESSDWFSQAEFVWRGELGGWPSVH